MEVRAKVKAGGELLRRFLLPRSPRPGLQPCQAFPLGSILGSANAVDGVQGTRLTRKSCLFDGQG